MGERLSVSSLDTPHPLPTSDDTQLSNWQVRTPGTHGSFSTRPRARMAKGFLAVQPQEPIFIYFPT